MDSDVVLSHSGWGCGLDVGLPVGQEIGLLGVVVRLSGRL